MDQTTVRFEDQHNYQVIAYYHFVAIGQPKDAIDQHRRWLEEHDATARIYINEQGINAQMSIATQHASAYVRWLRSQSGFETVEFKVQGHHEHAFPRLTVKYRKQLVALDREVDLTQKGEHVSPSTWRRLLEEKGDRVIVDVRNDYESRLGYFEGAELPQCNTFREFSDYAEELSQRVDPDQTKVMMYCTGGIRCEYYSAFLRQRGFQDVVQLDGGVLRYGEEENGAHWKGKLFVFDDRLAVPVGDDDKEIIGRCHYCNAETERVFNCANTDCNALFLSCDRCIEQHEGCCQESCQKAPRVRPYQQQQHKPFRRWSEVVKEKRLLWRKRNRDDEADRESPAASRAEQRSTQA